MFPFTSRKAGQVPHEYLASLIPKTRVWKILTGLLLPGVRDVASREGFTSQIAVADLTEEELVPARPTKEHKLKWFRLAKNRAKYHELRLVRILAKHGWNVGRRYTASGPSLGLADVYAVKDTPEKYIIALFQVKPRKHVLSCYFNGIQILSLLSLETVYEARYHSNIIQIDRVLCGVLKGGVIYHSLIQEDIESVGLTTPILDRLVLTDPVGCMKTLQDIPSPIEMSSTGTPLTNYYEYLRSRSVVLNVKKDKSNWAP